MDIIEKINAAQTTTELSQIVEEYLEEIGEAEAARGEAYGETAARLGGDAVLERAEARWFEVEAMHTNVMYRLNSEGVTELQRGLDAHGKPGLRWQGFVDSLEDDANTNGLANGRHAQVEIGSQYTESGRPYILHIEPRFFDAVTVDE